MNQTVLNYVGNGCLVFMGITSPAEYAEDIQSMGMLYCATTDAEEAAAAAAVAKHPLTGDKLKRLAAKYKVPAEWQGDAGLR